MKSNEFEHAFSDFIDGKDYDAASAALFAIVRAAFEAGWQASENSRPETTEDTLYMARLTTLHIMAEKAMKELKADRPDEALETLQRGLDHTDKMLSYWDPDKKDYDKDFYSYLFG